MDSRYVLDKRNANEFHNQALDHLKQLGYSGKAIEDSLKSNEIKQNNIYDMYKKHIDKNIMVISQKL